MFSDKLRLLRQEAGLTQIQTAERVGISWRTYQDLEAGKYPSYTTLLKIADTFQVSVDWLMGRTEDRELLAAFIRKCKDGIYSQSHLQEANALLEKWVNGTLLEEWNTLWVLKNTDPQKKVLLDRFVQKYAQNMTDTAMEYKAKAEKLYEAIEDAEKARMDWIDAKKKNTILAYVEFLKAHPYSEYREEAEELIQKMKGDLLTDMKCYPFKYSRDIGVLQPF